MDIPSLLLGIGIAAYVLFEYRRREELHQRDLALLRKGERPADAVQLIPAWKVFTSGGVLILLMGATAYMAHLALRAHPRYALPLILMTGTGIILLVVVGLMFFRNLAGYRRAAHPGEGTPR
jgi:hypothetical protein